MFQMAQKRACTYSTNRDQGPGQGQGPGHGPGHGPGQGPGGPSLDQDLGGDQFLSSGPGDCELLVDPEVFGRGGVGVDSEYVLSAGPEGCELSVDPGGFE